MLSRESGSREAFIPKMASVQLSYRAVSSRQRISRLSGYLHAIYGTRHHAYLALALLRIATVVLVLLSPESRDAMQVAEHPMGALPFGLGWASSIWPHDPASLSAIFAIQQVALLFSLVGVSTPVSLAVAAASTLILWAIAQTRGPTLHDMHLLWMLVLLALSPCEHWLARESVSRDPRDPRVGLLGVRVVLGLVYFFPGLHKAIAGTSWWSGETLILQAHYKWLLHGVSPFRFDLVAGLPTLMAGSAVAFELSFIALALLPRTRSWALSLGLGFHLFNQIVLHIPFYSLWGLYVVLLPDAVLGQLESLLERWGIPAAGKAEESDEVMDGRGPGRADTPAAAAGLAVVFLASGFGFAGRTEAWPFACYPKFSERPPPSIPDLRVDVDGAALPPNDDFRHRSDARWGEVFSLLGGYGATNRAAQLREASAALRSRPECRCVRLIRLTRSTDPARGGTILGERSIASFDCAWLRWWASNRSRRSMRNDAAVPSEAECPGASEGR